MEPVIYTEKPGNYEMNDFSYADNNKAKRVPQFPLRGIRRNFFRR